MIEPGLYESRRRSDTCEIDPRLHAQAVQQVVEAPGAPGPVVLRLPDGSAAAAGGIAGERPTVLELGVVETPDVAKVARKDPVVLACLVAIGEGDAGDGSGVPFDDRGDEAGLPPPPLGRVPKRSEGGGRGAVGQCA